MDGYIRISSRLKLGPVGQDGIVIKAPSLQPRQTIDEPEIIGSNRPSIFIPPFLALTA